MEDLLPYFLDFKTEITDSKDAEKSKAFWLKLAWEMETCSEAAELFPDMRLCPVCLERESDGHLVHKFSQDIRN